MNQKISSLEPVRENRIKQESRGLSATDLQQRRQAYIAAGTADNTRIAYRSAIRQFEKWGGYCPASAEKVIEFITNMAEIGRSMATLELYLTAISQWHVSQGLYNPCQNIELKKVFAGIKKTYADAQEKAKALSVDEMLRLPGALDRQKKPKKVCRDRALLLTGFLGAFRRSELVAIQVEDLVFSEQGVSISMHRSKTDQEGKGSQRAIPVGSDCFCAVTALKKWLAVAEITSGPVFRRFDRWGHIKEAAIQPGLVNKIIKKAAVESGFEKAEIKTISSHSLRRGFATSAAKAGAKFRDIKKQGGWINDATVNGYIDAGRLFEDNAVNAIFDAFQ